MFILHSCRHTEAPAKYLVTDSFNLKAKSYANTKDYPFSKRFASLLVIRSFGKLTTQHNAPYRRRFAFANIWFGNLCVTLVKRIRRETYFWSIWQFNSTMSEPHNQLVTEDVSMWLEVHEMDVPEKQQDVVKQVVEGQSSLWGSYRHAPLSRSENGLNFFS